ncbi:hypothetical protein BGX38DRAFT_1279625 [Terfezia claveryi]|nr:hypothetical protein BGX38DRAFT_1279625 [Terfezia claveryi]
MPQRKRKDSPGKVDKRNPPLKTRLPVTGHPTTATTEASHQSSTATHPVQLPPPTVAVHDDYESDNVSDHCPVQPPPPQATVADHDSDDEEGAMRSHAEARWIQG